MESPVVAIETLSASSETPRQQRYGTLRWIAVLPAAIAAGFLAPVGVWLSLWLFASPDPSRFEHLICNVGQAIAMGWGFVGAGANVAPTHRGKVALVLAGIAIFVMGGLVFAVVVKEEWSNIALILVSLLAAATTAYLIHEGST